MLKLVLNKSFPVASRWRYIIRILALRCVQARTHTNMKFGQIGHCMFKLV